MLNKQKSIISELSGRFSTIVIKNSRKNQRICGKVIKETDKQYMILDRNTAKKSYLNKSSIKYIRSGNKNFEFN